MKRAELMWRKYYGNVNQVGYRKNPARNKGKEMKILAFWSVDSEFERDAFECMPAVDAFDLLWHKRDELNARFYDLDARLYNDSDWQNGIGSISDFEDDYNDEILDGGMWCKMLYINKEDVKLTINE